MSRLLASSLGVVCPTCDVLGPPGSLRCEACGTPFVAGLAPPAPAPPPPERAPTPAAAAPAQEPPPPAASPAAPQRPSAPVASRYILGLVSGPARGQRFRLMANGCTVGR